MSVTWTATEPFWYFVGGAFTTVICITIAIYFFDKQDESEVKKNEKQAE